MLLLAGAAAVAVAAILPWVTVRGLSIGLDLGPISARVSPGSRTVAGTDTPLWPALLVIAAVVATLAVLGAARGLLLALGLIVTAGAAGLLYYVSNAVEMAVSGRSTLERALAEAVITSSTGPGPPLLLAGGLLILAGAALMR